MAEFRQYLDLRKQIITGSLKTMRPELIHLLYKLYIKQLRNFISIQVRESKSLLNNKKFEEIYKREMNLLIDLKKDFSDIES